MLPLHTNAARWLRGAISIFGLLLATPCVRAQPDQPFSPTQTSAAPAPLLVIPMADGSGSLVIDTSAAPQLTDWAQHELAPVLAAWYPKIAALLPSAGYSAPAQIHLAIKRIDGVAYTSGTDIVASASWCLSQKHGEAIGSLVHEMVHVVQQYRQGHAPGWLVEGLADYIRWFRYEPQSHGADLVWMRHQGKNFSPRYDGSYRVSANFLDWAAVHHDTNLITEVNADLRDGKYTDDFWKQHTGKTVQELGAEWKRLIEGQVPRGQKSTSGGISYSWLVQLEDAIGL
jgi:hypothetical protein